MHLVDNERIKLTATWFNTLSTALIAAGVFAPAAAMAIGFPQLPITPLRVGVLASGCIVGDIATHMWARCCSETTRMSFETFALIWPFIGIGLAIGGVLLLIRVEGWHERRKADRGSSSD